MDIKKRPTFLQAISCIIFMVAVIAIGNGIFKMPVQPLLIFCAAYAAILGIRLGYTWREMEKGISQKLEQSMPTMFILFSVGIIVGTWVFSGTVPLMIYYGLKIINPQYFLVTAFLIVAIVSVATGTAWGSTATAGVALMGVATEMGIPAGMAAGAIIAGGVFGDKLSPLSDTTNLAPLVCGVDLFDHIRHMFYTTIPSSLIAIVIYFIVGRNFGSDVTGTSDSISLILTNLDSMYNFSIILLIPIIIIVVGSIMKKPTVPLMLISSLVAIFLGVFVNGFNFTDGMVATVSGFNVNMAASATFNPDLAAPQILKLVNRGGINSMMNIVITIFCGYSFAGILEKIGCLEVILEAFSDKVTQPWQLVGVTIIGSLILVFTAGVASISILMMGTLLKDAYVNAGLHPKNLSRTLEDAGTMILPFVPWGASGIFYAEILGVNVSDYWMWTIPCYLCIVFAMICAFTGFGIAKIDKESKPQEA